MPNGKHAGVVYCLENICNGKKYIGSTVNFSNRKSVHLSNYGTAVITHYFFSGHGINMERVVLSGLLSQGCLVARCFTLKSRNG